MEKLRTDDKERALIYYKQVGIKNKAPYVIFLHGLMSNMNGQKAVATAKYCQEKGYNFIKFDNFGHGASSGKFIDQTISTWLDGVNLIIEKLTDGPILLIGSSMGAWLALIAAKIHPGKIIGVITIAAAVDFTQELIWNKFTNEEKDIIKKQGIYEVHGSSMECSKSYPISYKLIEDGRKHLMLSSLSENNISNNISIYCPVQLIHGMQDFDVPYDISLRLADKLKSPQVVVKLIKDADHKLSREEDLLVLYNSIEELLNLNKETIAF